MMGHRQVEQAALFYEFSLEGHELLLAATAQNLRKMAKLHRGFPDSAPNITGLGVCGGRGGLSSNSVGYPTQAT